MPFPADHLLCRRLGSSALCCSLSLLWQVIRGLEFDWIVGAAAVVVALSVQAVANDRRPWLQVFTLAGQRQ